MQINLPLPTPDAQEASQKLCLYIQEKIKQNHGWISFSDYMQLALYTPQYGYYTGGTHKIGEDGDFITAATLTPLFGQTLTTQLIQILPQTEGNIYEFGAGTGTLALDIVQEMEKQGADFKKYYIIEVSPELQARQRAHIEEKLPSISQKIIHLDTLPEVFDGIIIGNEVLDAMPCERICWQSLNEIEQIGVTYRDETGLTLQNQPLTDDNLLNQAKKISIQNFPYESELHPTQQAFITTLAEKLIRGAMIWIDYGFEENQYYFSERSMGTFIGHYRHHTIHDPFFYPGLCDLTSHIDFTAIAQAGIDAGLDLAGYTSQANFLINLDLPDRLVQVAAPETSTYILAAKATQKLIAEYEMGELFKVIALTREIDVDHWLGFQQGDRCHKL